MNSSSHSASLSSSPSQEPAPAGNWFPRLLRERSVQIALLLWIAASFAVFPLSGISPCRDAPSERLRSVLLWLPKSFQIGDDLPSLCFRQT